MSEIIVTGDRHYVPTSTSSMERFRFYQEDGTGKLSVQITRDGGESWKAIASEPPSNVAVGWIPTIAENGTIRWMSPTSVLNQNSIGSGSDQSWIDFSFPAELQSGAAFGMFQIPVNTVIRPTEIQVNLFTPPARSGVSVSIENAVTGLKIEEIGDITLSVNQVYNSSVFTSNFDLIAGTRIRAKINTFSDDELTPGSFLVARLIFERV